VVANRPENILCFGTLIANSHKTTNQDLMKLIAIAVVSLGAVFLASCNTVSGLGRDVGKVGQKLEKTASN
jgi:predicted small secreted protein